jgi:hypothetical protein
MKRFICVAVVTLADIACSWAQTAPSLPAMLASIDAGKRVEENSPEARRVAAALKDLRSVCKESDAQLGEAANTTRKIVAGKGGYATNADILEGLFAMSADFGSRQTCSSTLDNYAIQRTAPNAFTHSMAVAVIRHLHAVAFEASRQPRK